MHQVDIFEFDEYKVANWTHREARGHTGSAGRSTGSVETRGHETRGQVLNREFSPIDPA
jgi:hypothetical protein